MINSAEEMTLKICLALSYLIPLALSLDMFVCQVMLEKIQLSLFMASFLIILLSPFQLVFIIVLCWQSFSKGHQIMLAFSIIHFLLACAIFYPLANELAKF